jgi:hypothetical protein
MNTDVEPLTNRQQEMQILHQQWMQQPCTKAALEILEQHQAYITNVLANSSSSESVSDSKIRQMAVQLKTCQTVQTMLFNPQVFVSKLGKQSKQ